MDSGRLRQEGFCESGASMDYSVRYSVSLNFFCLSLRYIYMHDTHTLKINHILKIKHSWAPGPG